MTAEQMSALYHTAVDAAEDLENGNVEPAYSALEDIANALVIHARRMGITLDRDNPEA